MKGGYVHKHNNKGRGNAKKSTSSKKKRAKTSKLLNKLRLTTRKSRRRT